MTLTEAGSASTGCSAAISVIRRARSNVLLGHPLDDELGARVIAVDRVGADQLEVDVPFAHGHARVVSERVARLAHRGDEP